ncbi:MAG: N-acetylneuraminate synthase family protein [Chloroflexota bacterium]
MNKREDILFGTIALKADRPYLIAEAGVNYENDMETAVCMVEEATAAGADAIKFQSYKAETLASRFSPSYWDTTKESTKSQFELFKKYDHFDIDDYATLATHAARCGIDFLTTPFDVRFADALVPLMPVIKVASADLTNHPFLRHIAPMGKPVILSVGASTLGEVDEAVRLLKSEGVDQIALLHCVLSYPCDPSDANLGVIQHLQVAFPDLVVGYSDHVPPAYGCATLTTAWLLGARIIEKHFTLDKTKSGNDHYHAMDPEDMRAFRSQCDYVTALIGSDHKEVFACEAEARQQARRSLVAARALRSGETVTRDDILVKRPGTGINPRFLDVVVGARIIGDIQEDEILQWEMFLARGEDHS